MIELIHEKTINGDRKLGITQLEMADELQVRYASGNPAAVRELFEAYLEWEMDGAEETPEQVRTIAAENFDYLAFHLDFSGGKPIDTIGMGILPTSDIGATRQFVREAIGFNPQQPSQNP